MGWVEIPKIRTSRIEIPFVIAVLLFWNVAGRNTMLWSDHEHALDVFNLCIHRTGRRHIHPATVDSPWIDPQVVRNEAQVRSQRPNVRFRRAHGFMRPEPGR